MKDAKELQDANVFKEELRQAFEPPQNEFRSHVAREDCLHLADPEWEALRRLSTVIGEAAVATMLRTLSPTEQHDVALGFIMKERRKAAARAKCRLRPHRALSH
ncbi:hypothetical protein PR003_g1025 [Phytophthora rubi]|uniref:Uncharacterized protein n=1 Tax=Phytophthora rubi TaxID=129364 RepID=A0A6A4G4C2_9STRA|nr:hypothetical protein PR002_g948 [Phytophthora rubi]KAE9051772.1 hypothetical protein PR001_g1125 [Phytophthora rubi]KAE9358900.1 hypothetical protein PR003_g1025 [Phytophthora rubi]